VKLFQDFGGDASISWSLDPAVRDPKGACIEESNCDWELATVCAFTNATVANRVSFLACMDETNSIETTANRQLMGGGGGSALTAAKKCAPASQVDATNLASCFSGPEGQTLLSAAAKVWVASKLSSVPHTWVDQKTVDAEYSALKSALCGAGSTAAVCKSPTLCEV